MATLDGLVAPEGTYKMVASYVLPPQPAFMAPVSGPSSMQPMSNATGQAAWTSSSQQPNAAAAGANSTAVGHIGSSSANATSVLSPSSASMQSGPSGGQSSSSQMANANSLGAQGSMSNSIHGHSVIGEAKTSTLIENDRVQEFVQPKTALSQISMQAPSAWSHVPILPPSKISVASVRHMQQQASISSLPSVPGLAGRKERQQASLASATATTSQSGSLDGSNGSNSDLAGAVGIADGVEGKVGDTGGNQNGNRAHWGPVLECTLASQGVDGVASHVTGGQGGLPGMAALHLLSHLGNTAGAGEGFAGYNVASSASSTGLTQSTPLLKNLPKPKNSIRQTSSSFVQRLQSHPDLNKLLAPRTDGLSIERHAFTSRGRIIFWLGETSNGWLKDPLARLTFALPISSHDINQHTRSPNRLDLIIGFTSSDLLWLEAVSMRYSRINKGGCVNEAPITSVRWIPGSETLFLSCHSDGTCTLFDVTRDDSAAGSWTPNSGMTTTTTTATSNAGHVLLTGEEEADEELQEVLAHHVGDLSIGSTAGSDGAPSLRGPAVNAWNPLTSILVTRPAAAFAEGDPGRKQWSKMNPIAHWRVSRGISIKDVAFSPDHTKLAIVSTDGTLRLVNLLTESLEGSFQSYYGALNRVVWSHDARFLLTAGCDDLISIWTNDGRLLSRCIGHSSFVTGLAFDPWKWRPEDRTYRFVSVGEDGRILLWDFSSAALHRPRMPHSAHSSNKRQGGGGDNVVAHRRPSATQEAHGAHSPSVDHRPIYHSAQSRGEVAELQPVGSFQLGPLASTTPAESTNVTVIPFTPSTMDSALSASHVDGTANNGGASATTATSASTTNNGNANGANAIGTASGTANVFNSALPASASAASANEPGGPNDLLVDVRCLPDGIVVLHKSGTLRYLLRPLGKSTAHATLSHLRARS